MGLFLLLAGLYIAPWMLGFAGWYSHQPYRDILFYVPFHHLFLIGPFVFFYVSSLLDPSFKLAGRNWLHFLPAACYIIFCIIMVVTDKLILGRYYFLKSGKDPDFDDWYQISGYVSIIVYFFASLRYYFLYRKTVEAVISNAADVLFNWVRNFLVAFCIILIIWLIVAVFGLFYHINFLISWWYFLLFALCCYYIAIAGYSNSVQLKLFFKSSFLTVHDPVLIKNYSPLLSLPYKERFEEVYIDDAIASNEPVDEFPEWKAKIEHIVEKQELYKNPELSLFDLARVLNTNVGFLSKVINRSFNLNFNDLINSYRIARFIGLLNAGEHKKQTLLAIAFDCGFNSKTTFNRSFKKIVGDTPQRYIEKNNI